MKQSVSKNKRRRNIYIMSVNFHKAQILKSSLNFVLYSGEKQIKTLNLKIEYNDGKVVQVHLN